MDFKLEKYELENLLRSLEYSIYTLENKCTFCYPENKLLENQNQKEKKLKQLYFTKNNIEKELSSLKVG